MFLSSVAYHNCSLNGSSDILSYPIVFHKKDGAFMSVLKGIPFEHRFHGAALRRLIDEEGFDFTGQSDADLPIRVKNPMLCKPEHLRYVPNQLIKMSYGPWAGEEAVFAAVGVVTDVDHGTSWNDSSVSLALSDGIHNCLHTLASVVGRFQYYNVASRQGGLKFTTRFRSFYSLIASRI